MPIKGIAETEDTRPPSCAQVLEACNAAVESLQLNIRELESGYNYERGRAQELDRMLARELDEVNKWYRDPVYIGGAGIILGLILSGVAR